MVKGAKWYWAGDSKGVQDAWVEYSPSQCDALERAYQNKRRKTVKVDDDRFVTFGNRKDKMTQKRYDDTDKQRTVKRETPKKKNTEVDVSWYWSGDSKHGDKDVWIEYDHPTANKLERAFKRSIKKTKLDSERFIDMSDKKHMLQRRYSDPELARFVKREEHVKSTPVKAALVLMA